MTLTMRLVLAATSLLCAAQTATAIPRPSNSLARALMKRDQVTFEDCGDDNDSRRIAAGTAWSEAANLASATIGGKLDDGTAFKDTNAFKNYFEADDEETTSLMYSGIQSGSSGDSGNAFQLKFIITCKETSDCKDSLALTDAKPGTKTFTPMIRLCPKFFTDSRTKNTLNSKTFKRHPGRREKSWCQPGQPFRFFETGAHTFLHEMTHLDQMGVYAKLTGADNTHGTEDIYQIASGYDVGNPEGSARKLKKNWAAGKKPDLRRTQNAEGYAAAATAFFFQKQCDFNDIQP